MAGAGGGVIGAPRPSVWGGWGNAVLSLSVSPPQLAEMEIQPLSAAGSLSTSMVFLLREGAGH